MAQVNIPNGIALGAPGAAPKMVYVFADAGDPNSRSDPLSLLAKCALASLFLQIDSGTLWIKTAVSVPGSSPNGTWTSK
jgi:hypothetical protein